MAAAAAVERKQGSMHQDMRHVIQLVSHPIRERMQGNENKGRAWKEGGGRKEAEGRRECRSVKRTEQRIKEKVSSSEARVQVDARLWLERQARHQLQLQRLASQKGKRMRQERERKSMRTYKRAKGVDCCRSNTEERRSDRSGACWRRTQRPVCVPERVSSCGP